MAARKPKGTPAPGATRKRKAPILDFLVFTKCSSERVTNEDGMISLFDPKGAAMRLTATPSCDAVQNSDSGDLRAAISIRLEAEATNGEEGNVFYSGEVRALGFFICDPSMDEEAIEAETKENGSYFDGAFSVVHAIASRELERLVEITGIPAPAIPMGGDPDDFRRTRKSR